MRLFGYMCILVYNIFIVAHGMLAVSTFGEMMGTASMGTVLGVDEMDDIKKTFIVSIISFFAFTAVEVEYYFKKLRNKNIESKEDI